MSNTRHSENKGEEGTWYGDVEDYAVVDEYTMPSGGQAVTLENLYTGEQKVRGQIVQQEPSAVSQPTRWGQMKQKKKWIEQQ